MKKLPLTPTKDRFTARLDCCVFENKFSTIPLENSPVSWGYVVRLHRSRDVRSHKDGKMFGGYGLTGTRSNASIRHRSLIQLDIDSVVKDGNIIKAAPPIGYASENIKDFEWFAYSSHSHDPSQGVVKYRIVMLPDRDILPDEHEPILEALDERLGGGVLDRAAWPLSQAFYLPSCPAETKDHAFFVHNGGAPLPVDDFVERGREILAAQNGAIRASTLDPVNISSHPSDPETPENIDRCRSALAAVDPDSQYSIWRNVCWSVLATGWTCALDLVEEWSKKGSKFDHSSFNRVVGDFDPSKKIGVGTLFHHARDAGWADTRVELLAPADVERVGGLTFTGKGADVWNGRKFAATYRGKLLHVHETNDWLSFESCKGWMVALPGQAERAAKAVVDALCAEALMLFKRDPGAMQEQRKALFSHIERSCKASAISAMIEMAKSEPGMTARHVDLDADPMLLGLTNGILDLRSWEVLAPSPEILVTKRCNVAHDTDADCPHFKQYLKEVQPDLDVRKFLRRFMGYCLTGEVSAQKFLFLYGHGANGKSVFIELFGWLLGDYAQKIPIEMLMQHQRSPQGPSPDIVGLKGLRFAYANETEENRRLAESRVKDMTGGDTLTGRVPYAPTSTTFPPTHKLVIAGNHKPDIMDNSEGMWRRVLLVAFDRRIPENRQDRHLLGKLKQEGPGILNWMLGGLHLWKKDGLKVPKSITASTKSYRNEQDIVGEWLMESFDIGVGLSVKKDVVYANYTSWAKANGHFPMSQSKLTRRLNDRGCALAPDKRTVMGLSLKPPNNTQALQNI